MDTTFFVEVKGTYHAIKLDDVLYIFGTGYKSKIVTKKKKYNVLISLDSFEDQLPSKLFCKVHPFYIAAVRNINSFGLDDALFGDVSIPITAEGFQNIVDKLRIFHRESGRSLEYERNRIEWQNHFKMLRESGYTSDN